MSGFKQKIAYYFLFSNYNYLKSYSHTNNYYKYVKYLLLIFFISYFIVTCLYIFVFGLTIGSRATNYWLQGCLISLLQDILLLQPLKIWVKWIVLSSVVNVSFYNIFLFSFYFCCFQVISIQLILCYILLP